MNITELKLIATRMSELRKDGLIAINLIYDFDKGEFFPSVLLKDETFDELAWDRCEKVKNEGIHKRVYFKEDAVEFCKIC